MTDVECTLDDCPLNKQPLCSAKKIKLDEHRNEEMVECNIYETFQQARTALRKRAEEAADEYFRSRIGKIMDDIEAGKSVDTTHK